MLFASKILSDNIINYIEELILFNLFNLSNSRSHYFFPGVFNDCIILGKYSRGANASLILIFHFIKILFKSYNIRVL